MEVIRLGMKCEVPRMDIFKGVSHWSFGEGSQRHLKLHRLAEGSLWSVEKHKRFKSLVRPKKCEKEQKRIPTIRNQEHGWIWKALLWLCPLGIFRSIISLWVNPGWWHWMWKITCIILIKTEFANCLLLSEQSFFFNSLFGGRLAHSTPLEPPAFIPNSWSQHLLQLHL